MWLRWPDDCNTPNTYICKVTMCFLQCPKMSRVVHEHKLLLQVNIEGTKTSVWDVKEALTGAAWDGNEWCIIAA